METRKARFIELACLDGEASSCFAMCIQSSWSLKFEDQIEKLYCRGDRFLQTFVFRVAKKNGYSCTSKNFQGVVVKGKFPASNS